MRSKIREVFFYLLSILGRQYWIRFGIRYHLVKYFLKLMGHPAFSYQVNRMGLQFNGNINNFIERFIFFFGAYEREELLLLKKLVRSFDRPVFVDVGANIGQHSLFVSQYCANVYAFEPYSRVRDQFESCIKQNAVKNIQVFDFALGSQNTELPFYAPKGSNQGIGTFVDKGKDSLSKIGTFSVKRGDDVFAQHKLNKFHLIKIDVEGFEKDVLLGLRQTLARCRPIIFLEFTHHTRESFGTLVLFLQCLPSNYSIKKVVPNQKILFLFNIPQCQLLDFNFEKDSGNLLLIPKEKKV
jgi:FkbM family methyltransferase